MFMVNWLFPWGCWRNAMWFWLCWNRMYRTKLGWRAGQQPKPVYSVLCASDHLTGNASENKMQFYSLFRLCFL